ncbi:MAG: mechanosensitive ion channel family protein, partial [Myxococcales bacterium]|nr:mechanosensitive ion channel family protein [Myxococcales bacterium]
SRRLKLNRLHPQHRMLVRRAIVYLVVLTTVMWSLRLLGVGMSVVLGTAGILTVAIGFAAQTSASNLISGLFLMGERPFVIGDTIKVADVQGEVVSIDLLSVKVRTFDNLLVRIPNETMLKSNVTTLTAYPLRRYDLQIGVAYKESIAKVKKVLREVAEANPVCLDEPKPSILFQSFGDSQINFQFSVWAVRDNYVKLRNEIAEQVKAAFDAAGIEIPFPHRTLYTGSVTEPFPVRVVPEPPPKESTPDSADASADAP